jgi:hypothetical protein
MLKIFYTILFSTIFQNQYAQSIPSHWMNIYPLQNYFVIKSDSVDNMVVDVKEYYSSGELHTTKWSYSLLNQHLIMGIFSKNDIAESRFQYVTDTLDRLISSKINFKSPLGGWYKEGYEFEYIGNKRVSEKHFSDTTFLRFVQYTYDEKDYLTKIALINPQNILVSYETAEYSKDRKSYTYEIFNDKDGSISKTINYSNLDVNAIKLNAYNDIVEFVVPTSNPQNKTICNVEYKYDKYFNWVEKKIYLISEGKRKIQTVAKRKIKYKKK